MPFVYSIGSTVLATFTGVLNVEKQTHRPRNVQRRQECASFVLCILRGIVLTRKLSLEVAPTTSETFSRPWHSRTCFACFSRVIKSRVHVKTLAARTKKFCQSISVSAAKILWRFYPPVGVTPPAASLPARRDAPLARHLLSPGACITSRRFAETARQDRAGFWQGGLLRSLVQCVMRKFSYLQNKGTLSQTLDSENTAVAHR